MIYLLITINWVRQLIMMPPVILGVLVMLSVNTNLGAIAAYSAQAANTRSTATVMQQLSTGKRINSSVDDVAGLAISTRLMSQIRGLNQAIRNTNDGISLLQTAESAYGSITNALQRMRELRVQSLNDTNNTRDKAYIESEITSLKSEVQRIVKTTQFNGATLLDGSAGIASSNGSISYQFGTSANGDQTSVRITNLKDFASPAFGQDLSTPFYGASNIYPTSGTSDGIAAADFDENGTIDLVFNDRNTSMLIP